MRGTSWNAQKLAGLELLDGGDFHPYRRKWATERKHLPVQDVHGPQHGPRKELSLIGTAGFEPATP